MGATVHKSLDIQSDYHVSHHAWQRMSERSLSSDIIHCVINYGRVAYVRGATISAVGRKEIKRFEQDGIDLSGAAGVQVVCSDGGVIMTVYRNHDFRGLRPRRRCSRRRS